MDIFADISAIQNRIAEITGASATPPPTPGAFNAALARALAPQNAAVPGGFVAPVYPAPAGTTAAAGLGPAPVPPPEIDALVQQNAATYGVDPALIRSIIANESSFNANATSGVGAQGLMQLMPETAAGLGVTNAYDPAQNVAGGTAYLRQMLEKFHGDTRLAVAAYNAGPAAVEKYGDVPPYAETRNYVQNVLASLDKYRAP